MTQPQKTHWGALNLRCIAKQADLHASGAIARARVARSKKRQSHSISMVIPLPHAKNQPNPSILEATFGHETFWYSERR